MTTSLTRDETKWAGSVSLTSKSKTLTLNTADKYVDKDIELTVDAKEGSVTISGGSLTHGPITTTDETYLTGTSTNDGYKVTIEDFTFRTGLIRGTDKYLASEITVSLKKGPHIFGGTTNEATTSTIKYKIFDADGYIVDSNSFIISNWSSSAYS